MNGDSTCRATESTRADRPASSRADPSRTNGPESRALKFRGRVGEIGRRGRIRAQDRGRRGAVLGAQAKHHVRYTAVSLVTEPAFLGASDHRGVHALTGE